MQYLEIIKETTEIETPRDEHLSPGIGWEYDEEEEYEIQQTRIHPDMNPEYLINEPWWNEPIDIQFENYYYETEIIMDNIKVVVQQPLF